ncbi:hypothetical protein GCM10010401_12870 [Rarobacter faecitabidus]|uniref:Gp5/Type VI secretion system Vgr protein OB-fold domain-containing protein n=1 Tax=Rarobacter faecitabidus TaxID=13243 RepID=A0A542ZE95_RARFA|nr:phage baseplate assembly protein V [Rarobacter faecitabidus]TQL58664.1 hypothetical protein FB461_2082 [Rarobacter faecitabidus]
MTAPGSVATGPANPSLVGFEIKVGGTALSAVWLSDLMDLRVQLAVNTVGRAVLRFRDDGFKKAEDTSMFAPSAEVKINAINRLTPSASETSSVIIEGEVVALESSADELGQVFSVTVLDMAHKLTRGTIAVAGLKSKDTDLLTQIVQQRGLTLNATGTYVSEWLMYARSPIGAVQEVADRQGWHWSASAKKINMWSASQGTAPGAALVTVNLGTTLTALSVRDTPLSGEKVKVLGWDQAQHQEIVGESDPESSRAAIDFRHRAQDPAPTILQSHAHVSDATEAKTLAAARAGTGGHIVARGRGVVMPNLQPGGQLEIQSAGTLSGTYYVREVQHRFSLHGSSTEFVAGDRDAPQLTAPHQATTDSALPSRFDRLTIGVVTDVGSKSKDSTLGSVKVKFVALDNQIASHWASVMQLGAAAGRGLALLPEINDQVVIGFVDGDTRRPVVLGGLFSAKNQPDLPDDLVDGNGTVRVHSLVTANGDRLELHSGSEKAKHFIRLALKNGNHEIVLGEDGVKVNVPSGEPIAIKAGDSSITLDGNGSIKLKGTTIELAADSSIKLSAAEVKIDAKSQAELSSAGALKLKGAIANLEASGPVNVKGAVVNLN